MVVIVGIVSRHGLGIKVQHRNQPNKSNLVLYKLLLYCNSDLKWLYISNKIKRFIYKDNSGIHVCTRIKVFKRRVGLGYIQTAPGH